MMGRENGRRGMEELVRKRMLNGMVGGCYAK